MHFTTTTLLTLLTTALANPISKRTCAYEYLPKLWHISGITKQPAYPITTPMQVYRGNDGFIDTFVEFRNVPAGSYGCQFELDYKPGHPVTVTTKQGRPEQIDVYAVTGPIPENPTWKEMVGKIGGLVGTFNFPKGAELGSPKTLVINSFQCSETMRFRLTMNDWSLGEVSYEDSASYGLRMSHNC